MSTKVARWVIKRTTWAVLVVALMAAAAIGALSPTIPFNQNLIRLQTNERLVPIDPAMAEEPPETQAILLSYADDKLLLLQTWIGLLKYPTQTRELLGLYGSEAEFKVVLRRYGESVVPVIKYFIDHDLPSLRVRDATGHSIEGMRDWANGTLKRLKGVSGEPPRFAEAQDSQLDPTQRGRYAMQFIKAEGHQFLGQFDVDSAGVAKRNQTNRVANGIASFFTHGVSTLERKFNLNEEVEAKDVFFAAVDVVPFIVSLRLLRVGKVASAGGEELSIASRTRVLAPRLIPKSEFFWKLGKYSAAAATAYVVIKHPSLINSLLAEAAAVLGLPIWLVKGGFWFVLVFLASYPFLWLLKSMAQAILFALSLMETSRREFMKTMVQ